FNRSFASISHDKLISSNRHRSGEYTPAFASSRAFVAIVAPRSRQSLTLRKGYFVSNSFTMSSSISSICQTTTSFSFFAPSINFAVLLSCPSACGSPKGRGKANKVNNNKTNGNFRTVTIVRPPLLSLRHLAFNTTPAQSFLEPLPYLRLFIFIFNLITAFPAVFQEFIDLRKLELIFLTSPPESEITRRIPTGVKMLVPPHLRRNNDGSWFPFKR